MSRTRWKNINNYEEVYSYIFPYFQKKVHYIVEKLKKFDSVEKIIIFGSILTNNTGIDSDIDICIVGELSIEETSGLWMVENTPVYILRIKECC